MSLYLRSSMAPPSNTNCFTSLTRRITHTLSLQRVHFTLASSSYHLSGLMFVLTAGPFILRPAGTCTNAFVKRRWYFSQGPAVFYSFLVVFWQTAIICCIYFLHLFSALFSVCPYEYHISSVTILTLSPSILSVFWPISPPFLWRCPECGVKVPITANFAPLDLLEILRAPNIVSHTQTVCDDVSTL